MQFIASVPQKAYQKQGILTAGPAELVVMLYDGCIKNLKLAQMVYKTHDINATNRHLQKAQAILEELVGSLDTKQELSDQLMALYDFLLQAIAEANIKKDLDGLQPIIEIIETLRDTWREVSKTQKGHIRVETAL